VVSTTLKAGATSAANTLVGINVSSASRRRDTTEMRIKPSRPSPAMVVAWVAIFIALSGTGYAASEIARSSAARHKAPHNRR